MAYYSFYPDVDGRMRHLDASGLAWSTLVAAVGTNYDSSEGQRASLLRADTNTNEWDILDRGGFIFDTASIGDGETVSKATFFLKPQTGGITDNTGDADVSVYSGGFASDSAIVAGDFDASGSTEYADPIALNAMTEEKYTEWVFNATGLAAINKTGVTKLATRNANYDVANIAPTWVSGQSDGVTVHQLEQTGTVKDPLLTVFTDSSETSTFYPSAGAVAPFDGAARHSSGSSSSGYAWATLLTQSGNEDDGVVATTIGVGWTGSTTTDEWNTITEPIIGFDTQSILDTDTISSATFSGYGTEKTDPGSNSPTHNVYSASPAAEDDIAVGDYDNNGSTAFSSDISYASFSASGYNDWDLNASGISAINKDAVTFFSLRESTYVVGSSTPTWATWPTGTGFRISSADETGTSQDPKLVVVHGTVSPGPATLKTYDTVAVASVKTVNGIAKASVKTINTAA